MDSLDKLMGESISRKVELIRTKIGIFLINIQDVIGTSLKITGVWESWLIVVYGKVIQKEWTVIDAGANIGCHTIPFARLCKKVYAFEPQREVYNNLCSNIFLNGLDNIIIPIRKGLGDKVEKKQLWSIHHEDFNNGNQYGTGYMQFTIDNGKRCDAVKAFLNPIIHNDKLKIFLKILKEFLRTAA